MKRILLLLGCLAVLSGDLWGQAKDVSYRKVRADSIVTTQYFRTLGSYRFADGTSQITAVPSWVDDSSAVHSAWLSWLTDTTGAIRGRMVSGSGGTAGNYAKFTGTRFVANGKLSESSNRLIFNETALTSAYFLIVNRNGDTVRVGVDGAGQLVFRQGAGTTYALSDLIGGGSTGGTGMKWGIVGGAQTTDSMWIDPTGSVIFTRTDGILSAYVDTSKIASNATAVSLQSQIYALYANRVIGPGATGRVAFWSNDTTLDDSPLYFDGTSVGVVNGYFYFLYSVPDGLGGWLTQTGGRMFSDVAGNLSFWDPVTATTYTLQQLAASGGGGSSTWGIKGGTPVTTGLYFDTSATIIPYRADSTLTLEVDTSKIVTPYWARNHNISLGDLSDVNYLVSHTADNILLWDTEYSRFQEYTISAAGDVGLSGGTFSIRSGKVSPSMLATQPAYTVLCNNTAGTASPTAVTLTNLKIALALANVENTALSTWAGTTNITTVGTLTSGTLGAGFTLVAIARGGTAANTAAGARVNLLPSMSANAGRVLAVNPGETDAVWVAAGSGSVTSVALTPPVQFSVTGSPITTSGTFNLSWVNQTANTGLFGPATGAAAAPTFRAMVAADIPFWADSIARVVRRIDSLTLYVTIKRLADSLAAARVDLARKSALRDTVHAVAGQQIYDSSMYVEPGTVRNLMMATAARDSLLRAGRYTGSSADTVITYAQARALIPSRFFFSISGGTVAYDSIRFGAGTGVTLARSGNLLTISSTAGDASSLAGRTVDTTDRNQAGMYTVPAFHPDSGKYVHKPLAPLADTTNTGTDSKMYYENGQVHTAADASADSVAKAHMADSAKAVTAAEIAAILTDPTIYGTATLDSYSGGMLWLDGGSIVRSATDTLANYVAKGDTALGGAYMSQFRARKWSANQMIDSTFLSTHGIGTGGYYPAFETEEDSIKLDSLKAIMPYRAVGDTVTLRWCWGASAETMTDSTADLKCYHGTVPVALATTKVIPAFMQVMVRIVEKDGAPPKFRWTLKGMKRW